MTWAFSTRVEAEWPAACADMDSHRIAGRMLVAPTPVCGGTHARGSHQWTPNHVALTEETQVTQQSTWGNAVWDLPLHRFLQQGHRPCSPVIWAPCSCRQPSRLCFPFSFKKDQKNKKVWLIHWVMTWTLSTKRQTDTFSMSQLLGPGNVFTAAT